MPKIKWSSFPNGGPITTGDETVGLRGGANVSFDATQFETIDIDNININGNIISATNTNGNLRLDANGTGVTEVGDPGLETGAILVDGSSYNTKFRINDIGGIAPAQAILHKHSTTTEPILISARSNSNTSAHAKVTAGMPVLSIYGSGWLDNYYGTMASITFSADSTGTLADGSAPGRLQFNVTPNGSLLPVEAMRINNNGVATFSKDAVINTVNIGLGGGNIATNTRVGVSALGANTTSANITAVGYQALLNNTVADNTAVGAGAMDASTTGTGVAVGLNALGALTTGMRNTAVGTNALLLQTTANDCTAVGFQAGSNNEANSNCFVGFQAGFNNTSGQANTSLGRLAGRQFRTGNENTAIGNNAMGTLGTSAVEGCTYVGSLAGIDSTGNNNTGIGRNAGRVGATGAVTLTTGATNTMLGYRACPNAADAAGTISIGADAVANKATGATSADDGPGIAVGSAAFPVGFRGDGTIYPTAGSISGYMQVKINGTNYKIALYALS